MIRHRKKVASDSCCLYMFEKQQFPMMMYFSLPYVWKVQLAYSSPSPEVTFLSQALHKLCNSSSVSSVSQKQCCVCPIGILPQQAKWVWQRSQWAWVRTSKKWLFWYYLKTDGHEHGQFLLALVAAWLLWSRADVRLCSGSVLFSWILHRLDSNCSLFVASKPLKDTLQSLLFCSFWELNDGAVSWKNSIACRPILIGYHLANGFEIAGNLFTGQNSSRGYPISWRTGQRAPSKLLQQFNIRCAFSLNHFVIFLDDTGITVWQSKSSWWSKIQDIC